MAISNELLSGQRTSRHDLRGKLPSCCDCAHYARVLHDEHDRDCHALGDCDHERSDRELSGRAVVPRKGDEWVSTRQNTSFYGCKLTAE